MDRGANFAEEDDCVEGIDRSLPEDFVYAAEKKLNLQEDYDSAEDKKVASPGTLTMLRKWN